MIDGIVLGLMTFGSLGISFIKLPKKIQNWIMSHKLLTDVFAGVIVFLLLGSISKSITAVVGAISAGLLVGIALEVVGSKNVQTVDRRKPTSS